MEVSQVAPGLEAAAAVREPLRKRLMEYAARHQSPFTRDDAAAALGAPRSTVAFHLERLAEVGLLDVRSERVNGKTGPGAGRPSKVYSRSPAEFGFSIPNREYDLMGDLLASTLEALPNTERVRDALGEVAYQAGLAAGEAAESFDAVLDRLGCEPVGDAALSEGMGFANCPFGKLAAGHSELVCSANHAYLAGAAEATGLPPEAVTLTPAKMGCCITIRRAN
jgi:predicted ArsR family transcriptional regulator